MDRKELTRTPPVGDVIVFRGLPGSGKTTFANELVRSLASNEGGIVLSSDDFFISKVTEKYEFDPSKIKQAHKWNFERFKAAIEKKLSPIIIDNTNIKRFHYFQYVDYGQRHDYRVSVLIIPFNDVSDRELEERTPHGFERRYIRQMRNDFEWEI